jgi:hypothetical protein
VSSRARIGRTPPSPGKRARDGPVDAEALLGNLGLAHRNAELEEADDDGLEGADGRLAEALRGKDLGQGLECLLLLGRREREELCNVSVTGEISARERYVGRVGLSPCSPSCEGENKARGRRARTNPQLAAGGDESGAQGQRHDQSQSAFLSTHLERGLRLRVRSHFVGVAGGVR